MRIDAALIDAYLEGDPNFKHHWIFRHIRESGEYVFEEPPAEMRKEVEELKNALIDAMSRFRPMNADYFASLFPDWEHDAREVRVLLAVGCPDPYDAMVRQYEGEEYIIFDLIRFIDVRNRGYDPLVFAGSMMTHELAHICLHNQVPFQPPSCCSCGAENELSKSEYQYDLAYIVFDEGFAHLLSLSDDIDRYPFEKLFETHYSKSLAMLREACRETDPLKQRKNLEDSNSGEYKFGALCGLLYLGGRLDKLSEIYRNGPERMLKEILEIGYR